MKTNHFRAGMYLLETLTSGMYNDPLSIYREYVQNSVDSIDQSDLSPKDCKIQITLDPFLRSVTIRDNGPGITSDSAEGILSSIGSSGKVGKQLRGFRGIGRLGGIAFAKKVIFKTASKGEDIVSTQEWNCEELRKYLNSNSHTSMSIEELFLQVSTFSQCNRNNVDNSYFEVNLQEVESFRDYIFDIQRIKKYLAQVAPLPFSKSHFSFYDEVSYHLKFNLPQYGEYRIFVNDEQLFRPYKDDIVITNKRGSDHTESVNLFSLKYAGKPIAYGWYGVRTNLLGAISKGEDVSGIRVKVGNIQIGDNHLLDRCFRESRFNSYFIGEIHICDQSLLPNSRRDDFVDNEAKNKFYNLVEKEIGLPLSKEVRQKSKISIKPIAKEIDNKKFINLPESNSNLNELSDKTSTKPETPEPSISQSDILKQIIESCGECDNLRKILKKFSN